MAKENKTGGKTPSAGAPGAEGRQLQVHVAPDLEYVYRDMFNVLVGREEVVLEFGNRHRAMPDRATIANRIVLSIPNAFRLQAGLQQALAAARKAAESQAQGAGGGEKGGE